MVKMLWRYSFCYHQLEHVYDTRRPKKRAATERWCCYERNVLVNAAGVVITGTNNAIIVTAAGKIISSFMTIVIIMIVAMTG